MAIVGVLAASFSLEEQEPNPCNMRLGDEAIRVCKQLIEQGHTPILAVQWEIGLALQQKGTIEEGEWREFIQSGGWAYEEIGQDEDGSYLGTKEVFERALPFFKKLGATRFVGVANPFIHQPYLYWLARGHGMKLMWRHVRWIGFDKQSTQWWCRSWWQFAYQTVRLALGNEHGHNGRQEQSS